MLTDMFKAIELGAEMLNVVPGEGAWGQPLWLHEAHAASITTGCKTNDEFCFRFLPFFHKSKNLFGISFKFPGAGTGFPCCPKVGSSCETFLKSNWLIVKKQLPFCKSESSSDFFWLAKTGGNVGPL